jgi:hypothetical protein
MPRIERTVILSYAADAASAVFTATCVLLLVSVAGELRSAGMAASVLSPQFLVALAIGSGLLTLARPPSAPRRAARVGYAAVAALATLVVSVATWNGFAPLGEARPWLAVTAPLAGLYSLIQFRGPKRSA